MLAWLISVNVRKRKDKERKEEDANTRQSSERFKVIGVACSETEAGAEEAANACMRNLLAEHMLHTLFRQFYGSSAKDDVRVE